MNADLLLDELNIVLSFLRELIVFGKTSDLTLALPGRQIFDNGLASVELCGIREILCDDAVDLISRADRDLIQITQNVEVCEGNIRTALESYAVTCSNAVKPADSSRASFFLSLHHLPSPHDLCLLTS